MYNLFYMPTGSGIFHKVWRYGRWLLLVVVLAFVALFALGFWDLNHKQKTADAVAYIQSRHLTMDDVDGKHLPPAPSPAQAAATIAGIDENHNGIRDDVELAIFAKYPNDIKVRAAELQYAMAEQLYLTSVFSTETWKAVAEQLDRAYQCISDTYPSNDVQQHFNVIKTRGNEVEALVFNTQSRVSNNQEVSRWQTSFGLPSGSVCDVNL